MDLYGPELPPGYKRPSSEDSNDSDLPSTKKTNESKIIGPQCPDFILQKNSQSIENSDSSVTNEGQMSSNIIGPELPPSFQCAEYKDYSDDECYGPMPAELKEDVNNVITTIEKRAVNMRNKLQNTNTPQSEEIKREEWMIVPDTSRRNQLGAISRCLAPGSQKSSRKESHSQRHSEEEKEISKKLKKYNKSKRSETLLEMHQKKKKNKEKKSSEKKERKAFDRDEIAVRHFSKKQVDSVIDKAKYLNSRFAPGNKQYL
ncbi:hypothetical protein X975_00429, partial [Stegodyphus mimosarum]